MTARRVSTQGSEAVVNLAKSYAAELDAQFRTLNHFVRHAGEIGRAHETFLRGVLTRFLPERVRLTSGFVAHPHWTSRQQDILIHRRELSTLFEIGDCTVIDYNSFVGTIEVKTELPSSEEVRNAVGLQAELRERMRHVGNPTRRWHHGVYAIYAWDGVSFDTAANALWEFVRQAPATNGYLIPDVVYVRGKYIIMADIHSGLSAPPYRMWRIGEAGISEGEALLGIIDAIWQAGIGPPSPWWLLSWHDHLGEVFGKGRFVEWPDDLRSAMADLAKNA